MSVVIERLVALSADVAPRSGEPVGADALGRADALLRDWPDAHNELLFDLSGRKDRRWRLAKLPVHDHAGRPIAFLSDAVGQVLKDWMGTGPRRRAPGLAARFGTVASPVGAGSTPISHTAAMQRLEGRARERLARWWVEAGILTEAITPNGRTTLIAEEVSGAAMLLQTVAGTRGPSRHAVDAAFVDRSVANGTAYGKDDFLRDLLAGRIRCWRKSRVGAVTLVDLRFDWRDLERRMAVARIADWIRRADHVPLSTFAAEAERLWGPGACPSSPECARLAAAGRLRHRIYQPPGTGWPQKRWNVADLVRRVQRRRTTRLDVDAIEAEALGHAAPTHRRGQPSS